MAELLEQGVDIEDMTMSMREWLYSQRNFKLHGRKAQESTDTIFRDLVDIMKDGLTQPKSHPNPKGKSTSV